MKSPEGSFGSASEEIQKVRLTKTKTRTAEEEQDSNTAQDCSKEAQKSKAVYFYIPVHTDHTPTSRLCSAYHWVQC